MINVATGEIKFGQGDDELVSYGIGSCIVVTIYDAQTRTGAMLHIMLPGKAPEYEMNKTKYAYDAIHLALNAIEDRNISLSQLHICLIGGGNVLKDAKDTICQNNINSVTSILELRQLKIKKQVLGGILRRTARLDLGSGRVYYSENGSPEILLYETEVNK